MTAEGRSWYEDACNIQVNIGPLSEILMLSSDMELFRNKRLYTVNYRPVTRNIEHTAPSRQESLVGGEETAVHLCCYSVCELFPVGNSVTEYRWMHKFTPVSLTSVKKNYVTCYVMVGDNIAHILDMHPLIISGPVANNFDHIFFYPLSRLEIFIGKISEYGPEEPKISITKYFWK